MAKQDRSKKSTLSNALETFRAVSERLEPKQPLTDREVILFDGIIKSRERSTWDDNSIFLAGNLAIMYRRLEELNDMLNVGGPTMVNERGTIVANPAFNAMVQLTGSIQSMNRILGLSAAQAGVSGKPQAKRNRAEREIDELNETANRQQLLA